MSKFFTADTHFGHGNAPGEPVRGIIKYCNRPFKDWKDMEDAIVSNWNAVVGVDDDVYHLGDILFVGGTHTAKEAQRVLDRLNGRIWLVAGNHDHKNKLSRFKNRFEVWRGGDWYKDMAEVKVDDKDHPNGKQTIVLCHYAMRVWNKKHYGSWMVYGHSHGTLPDDPYAFSMDVGMDCHNFTPLSYEQIKTIMFQTKVTPNSDNRES